MPKQETSPLSGSSLEGANRADLFEAFRRAEAADIKNSKNPAAMAELLVDSEELSRAMLAKVGAFAKERGINETILAGGEKTLFGDSVREIQEGIDAQTEALFPDEDERKAARDIMRQYLRLLQAAMEDTGEFGISPRLTAGIAWRLIQENIWVMAYQNHHSNSIFMGDHGMQHIVHDVGVMQNLIKQQRRLGFSIPPGAELAGMQALIIHDVMYPDLQQTPKGKANPLLEEGHPLLAAHIVLQRSGDEKDLYAMAFPPAVLALIHDLVLTHDSIDFSLQGNHSPHERVVRSGRVGDATAVYWGKLTLLLRHESMRFKTLEAMRLLQTAGEIGGEAEKEIIASVRDYLRQQVNTLPDLSSELRQQMLAGVETLTPFDNKFELRRLAGTIPEYHLTDEGVLIITIEESTPNKRLAEIFGRDLWQPLAKPVADWLGLKTEEVDLTRDLRSQRPGVIVQVRKRLHEHPDVESDPHLQPRAQIPHHEDMEQSLRGHQALRDYAGADNELSARQKQASRDAEKEVIKAERLTLLRTYLESLISS